MILKRLEIFGFKSFPKRTVFELSSGITAIVGPNGAGKSNIADAIRWVLGEQSSKSLRTRRMDEVIFTGSGARNAMGMAEVSIVLDNESGKLPFYGAELTVTRRLYRTGESEYLVNGKRARLRDLQELLGSANVGQNDYTVIGQGLIDMVLSLRPEERRVFIEEAADVRRQYEKIEATQNRLAKTDGNLARVKDLLTELEPRVDRLRVQADRVRSAQGVSRQLQECLRDWHGHRVAVARRDLNRAREAERNSGVDLEEHKERVSKLRADDGMASARLEDIQERLRQLERERQTAGEDLNRRGNELALSTQRIEGYESQRSEHDAELDGTNEELGRLLEEQTSLEEKKGPQETALDAARLNVTRSQEAVAQIERDNESANRSLRSIEQARADHRGDVERLRARLDEIGRQLEEVEGSLATSEKTREQTARDVTEASEAHDQAALEYAEAEDGRNQHGQYLRQVDSEAEAARRGLADARLGLDLVERERQQVAVQLQLLIAPDSKETVTHSFPDAPTLMNLLPVPEGLEKALAAAIGDAFDARVVGSKDGVMRALRSAKSPEGKVIVESGRRQPAIPKGAGVVGRAGDLVAGAPRELRGLLDGILIVEDVKRALAVMGDFDGDVVTLGGVLFRPSGLIAFNAAQGEGARQVDEARSRAAVQSRLSDLEAQQRTAEAAVPAEEKAVQTAGENRAHHRAREAALAETEKRARQRLEECRRTLEQRRQDHEWQRRLAAEAGRTRAELKDQRDEVLRLVGEMEEATPSATREGVGGELEQLERRRRDEYDRFTEMRVAQTDAEAELNVTVNQVERLRQSIDRVRERRDRQQQRLSQLVENRDKAGSHVSGLSDAVSLLEAEAAKLNGMIGPLREEIDSLTSRNRQGAEHLRELEQQVFELERGHLGRESQRAKEEVYWDRLCTDLAEDDIEMQSLITEELEAHRFQEIDARLKTLRSQLKATGSTDVSVLEEYEIEQARVTDLQTQVQDLEAARESLFGVIGELEEHSERQFAIAFHAVAREFQSYFERFFGGGTARLILTQPDALGETGIDIEAQPPGKRLRSLALLSGGERALTAAALVFAVLQINPTPFCVLDEVDAALDEANVARFAEALRELSEKSQFILVTHNRSTIDRADSIYGVTMGGDGISRVVSIKLNKHEKELAAVG